MPVNPVPKLELSLVDPNLTPVKIDISAFVLDAGIQTNRGRSSELDRPQAGTATIALNNNDGRFDPNNAGTLVNLVVNPSVETNLTDYTSVVSAALVRAGGSSAFGGFNIQAQTTNVIESGVGYAPNGGNGTAVVAGTTYTFSGYVALAASGNKAMLIQVRWLSAGLGLLSTSNAFFTQASVIPNYTRWSVTAAAPATAVWARLRIVGDTAQGVWGFNTDAWQLEAASAASAYTDGDQDNCRWAGTAHASASYRGGPYYGQLRPLNRLYLSNVWSATTYPKIVGYAQGWTPTYPGPLQSVVNLQIVDAFSVLSIPILSMPTPYVDGADTNLLNNTSIEDDIDQYAANVATISQSTEQFYLGDKSLKLTTTNATDSHARYEKDDNIVVLPGLTYTFSVYAMLAVAAAKTFSIRIDFYNGASFVNSVAGPALMSDTDWHRFSACGVAGALADRAYLVFATNGAQGVFDAYLDAWQFEQLLTNITEMPAERSDLRVTRVLDAIGWPSADRVISTGASTLIEQVELSGVTALAYLQTIEQSENGLLYIDKSGRLAFVSRWDRTLPPYDTSQATWGQTGADFRYVDGGLEPSYDLTFVRNDIRLTGTQPNAIEQVAGDDVSKGHYYPRTLQITGLLISDNEADTACDYLLARYKDPQQRFVKILVEGRADPANQWPAILGRELGDRITIKFDPPDGPGLMTQDCFIEGIQHNFTHDLWQTTFLLSAFGIGTAVYPVGKTFFEINHATRGKLDTGTGVLVY